MPNRLDTVQRRLVSRIVAPVATLVGALILLVIVMVILLARQQTADALERERALARGMIDIRLTELSQMTDDYAHWDEALEKLGLHPDAIWADENIGGTMTIRYGVDMVFVIDGAGRTSYAMMHKARSDRRAEEVVTTGYREILGGRQTKGPDALASGLVIADGLPALVIAAPLRPFLGTVDTTRQNRNVLVFVDLLDETQLGHLSTIYDLPNLRVVSTDTPAPEASILLKTVDGITNIRLGWDGDDPGGRLLRRVLPLLCGLMSAFAAMTFFVLRQAWKAAEELRIAEDKASRDPLSGLWNRAMLARDLDRRFSGGTIDPFALFYLDLDGFKLINDTYGHDIGDVVIRMTCRRIEQALPAQARAYRIGGDEFAVIVFGALSQARLLADANAIAAAVSPAIAIDGLSLRIGVTIGIARAPTDAISSTKIVRVADQALYAGKRAGKGTVRFADPLHQSVVQIIERGDNPRTTHA